jgi:putative DNA primase/helicase
MFSDCSLLGKPLGEGKYAVVCPWQTDHTGGKEFDSSTVIFPASAPGGLGGFCCSHSHCSRHTSKDAFDALRRRADEGQVERAWMAQLARSKEGRVVRSFRNVCMILRHDSSYASDLRFDEMLSTVLLREEEMRDSGISAIRIDLDQRYLVAPSEADAVRAVQYVSERNRFHPVRTFLKGLTWDGEPRLARVTKEILGVEPSSREEDSLLALLVRRWFIAAVARPLKPGIKVDSVLILVGRQGGGKSTFFRVLGGEWFSDTEMGLDKDGLMQLGGSWIYEWAELENVIGRNTTSRVKQFVTSDRDRFRPPFGRTPITVLRTSIIVGTTNLDSFLHDPTGSRRFWVIPVGSINEALLRKWREQLLAEAVAAYRSGERHWLSDEEEALRQEFVSQFNETDPWEEAVLAYAHKCEHLRLADVLNTVLGLDLDRQTRREEHRVAAILRRNGWEPTQRRLDGQKQRLWYPGRKP